MDICKHFFAKPYGDGSRATLKGVLIAELARGDAGLATIYIVQCCLMGKTIELLGSEEQKAKYLPKIISMEWIGGWGLTEAEVGSDAVNINTTATTTDSGYRIKGNKRWIGNGDRDLLVAWARNTSNKNVEAYVL